MEQVCSALERAKFCPLSLTITDCLLNFQGSAQSSGKNTLILAVKYHLLWSGFSALLLLTYVRCDRYTAIK